MFKVDRFNVSTNDGRNFILLEAVDYFSPLLNTTITIPTGCTSDGASTPAIIWFKIPPFGLYWKAAYLHDYLYRFSQYPKDVCDNILKEAMLGLGVDDIVVKEIYDGVTLGGASSFTTDRQNQQLVSLVIPAPK